MAQRRFHYEQAFEHYLRANRIPYVAVDEAKKSILPGRTDAITIKNFDFVIYTKGRNLLVDVKGRKYGSSKLDSSMSNRRFESWVTRADIEGMQKWQDLFGEGFEAVFVFAYYLRQQPPDALFETVFAYGNHWYALREIPLDEYCRYMVTRSTKWETVHLPVEAYRQISRPFRVEPITACGSSQSNLC